MKKSGVLQPAGRRNTGPRLPRFALVAPMTLVLLTAGCAGPDGRGLDESPGLAAPLVAPMAIASTEYAGRRNRLLATLSDGIVLLHARPSPKSETEWGFVQDPSFYYFTGLSDLTGAVLALDGPSSRTTLFLPPAPESFGFPVPGLVPAPGEETAAQMGVDAAYPWEQFGDWVQERLDAGTSVLYVDEPRRPEPTGVPPGFAPAAGHLALWAAALEARFPRASIRSAKEAIHAMRSRKSEQEGEILAANARLTSAALAAVARVVEPGMRQRAAEAVVVDACIRGGGQGPSFWPWIMSGPNAQLDNLVQAFFRYEQLDRKMVDGEVIRVDIGCAANGYGADVGRTLPVSGAFTDSQAEAWALLVAGYEAGLAVMAGGVPVSAVREASVAAIRERAPTLRTDQARIAAGAILEGGEGIWHIHGVGVESGEDAASVLQPGAVVAYEPMVAAGPDAFYLEDMILITDQGIRVLSADLPRSAAGIEAMMRGELLTSAAGLR
ncbi:MAG: aminopeptidase P family protein [Gemmatimonadetes bacterium]|nr:aminopeptidase P family protein [Gemmatimonadota bacterium]